MLCTHHTSEQRHALAIANLGCMVAHLHRTGTHTGVLLSFVPAMAGVGPSLSPNAAGVIPCLLWKQANDKLIMAVTASTAQVDHF